MTRVSVSSVILFCLLLQSGFCRELAAAEPMSWASPWGPEYNGISRERNIPLKWDEDSVDVDSQRQEMWEITEVSLFHPPLAYNNKLYLLYRESIPDPYEPQVSGPVTLSAWDISQVDAEEVFRKQIVLAPNEPMPQIVGDSPWRQLFVLKADGELRAYDSDLGYEFWTRPVTDVLPAEFRVLEITSPLIFDYLIITVMTCEDAQGKSFQFTVARDRRNGLPLWQHRSPFTAPGSPLQMPGICNFEHQVALAMGSGEQGRLQLLQIRTGKSIAQCQVAGGGTLQQIRADHNRLLALSKSPLTEGGFEWQLSYWDLETVDQMTMAPTLSWSMGKSETAACLLRKDQAFVAGPEGKLHCFRADQQAAQAQGTLNRSGPYFLQWVDDQLLVTSALGEWQVWKCQEEGCERIYDKPSDQGYVGPVAIVKQRIFIGQNTRLLVRGRMNTDDARSDLMIPLEDLAQETESDLSGEIQLLPAAVNLNAGRKQNFQLLQFNDRGAYLNSLEPAAVKWTWNGPGTFDAETGELQMPEEN
ncbi:MAG: hypothetical protein KDA78_15810, partial [Planctomycetaceae bacterium]|nr:hypothetical protein [Planctomycetaceae bacterium]